MLTGNCDSFPSHNDFPGRDDGLCTSGFDGNPIMYVDGKCANPAGIAFSVKSWLWPRSTSFALPHVLP